MLGPTDVDDWSYGRHEKLAAELRHHPVLRQFLRQPSHPMAEKARALSPLVERFLRHDLLSLDELLRLEQIVEPMSTRA